MKKGIFGFGHSRINFGKIESKRTFCSESDSLAKVNKWKQEILQYSETQPDEVSPISLHYLSLTLDRDDPTFSKGNEVPPSWHYIFFPPAFKEKDLAADGYDKNFSPPSPFLQRVWAGGSINFQLENPLRVGQSISQITCASEVDIKKGSRGHTVFVTLNKEIFNEKGLSIVDRRTLAYMRDKLDPSQARSISAPTNYHFERSIDPTPILLFRYSALTFNAHKIHYDYQYATQSEGYRGLLVHGPLQGTLLLDLVSRNVNKKVKNFSYRALSPLFSGEKFQVCGKMSEDSKFCTLWTKDIGGNMTMNGTATFE